MATPPTFTFAMLVPPDYSAPTDQEAASSPEDVYDCLTTALPTLAIADLNGPAEQEAADEVNDPSVFIYHAAFSSGFEHSPEPETVDHDNPHPDPASPSDSESFFDYNPPTAHQLAEHEAEEQESAELCIRVLNNHIANSNRRGEADHPGGILSLATLALVRLRDDIRNTAMYTAENAREDAENKLQYVQAPPFPVEVPYLLLRFFMNHCSGDRKLPGDIDLWLVDAISASLLAIHLMIMF